VNLGALLKSRREAAGLSLQDVADACSLSKGYVWEIEAGKTVNIGLLTAIRLSVALNVPVSAMCAAALDSAAPEPPHV
jgi:transcriptional regulator with XRE-family HTH domain